MSIMLRIWSLITLPSVYTCFIFYVKSKNVDNAYWPHVPCRVMETLTSVKQFVLIILGLQGLCFTMVEA
jgi:hypothetical protein